ncbi:MAG: glycosyltransferase [Phycisphaerae bacterium]
MIPRRLHFVWVTDDEPTGRHAENLARARRLHPGWEVRLWRPAALSPHWQPLYERGACIAHQADVLRYDVLERRGGWYLDTDTWLFRPLPTDLDLGGRLGVVRRRAAAWPASNNVLAAGAGCAVWPTLRRLAARMDLTRPLATSNRLLLALWRTRPDLVHLLPAEDWTVGGSRADRAVYEARRDPTGHLVAIHGWDGASLLPLRRQADAPLAAGVPAALPTGRQGGQGRQGEAARG